MARMSYSIESLMFRAIGCAVNTAAWAANGLLEQMYPREDIGHVWDDSPREGVEAAPAEAAGVDDAAGVVPPTPAASLTWQGWAVPAIIDVLEDHRLVDVMTEDDPGWLRWGCFHVGDHRSHLRLADASEWAEHVAPLIADRIACDPHRAVLALTSLQKQ